MTLPLGIMENSIAGNTTASYLRANSLSLYPQLLKHDISAPTAVQARKFQHH